MPKLGDSIHLDMYRAGGSKESEPYGCHWGHPDHCPPLMRIRDHFLRNYADPEHTALEIGPGGGRWTQYMLGFRRLYVVDYHAELLAELRRNFDAPNMTFVHNNGTDFPGVPDECLDFLFSFGVFVHLDRDLVERYLLEMRRILRPAANVVIQYSDKTKIMARENAGFADNTPKQMRALVTGRGYRILEEDLTTLWHSSVVRFCVDG